ncbi:MAG TPA: hypothetical protein PKL57_11995, partial [Candidatus Wallbacteria bacterium]|nr:hypothetical protein [Candidatus Wallbacteria bacterium]
MASYIEEGISQTAKFTLDINPILKSISINKTIDYISESSYDLSKISTTAIYSNKTSKTIKPTWIVVSGGGNINGEIFTPLTGSSNYILTASYTDNQIVKTATLTLSVKPLVASISLSKTTDTLFCGYSYDLSLITPVITYSNNTTNNLIKLASSSWAIKSGGGTLSGLNYTAPSTPGTTVLTASYTEDQVTKSADLTITILPLSSRTIVITQQPPSSVIAGATIAPSVIVKICDNSGNVVTSDNSTQITATALTPALSQASGNLSNATVTFNAGYATFNGLKYDKAENIILKFSVVGLASLQSNGILISPGALDHFSITSNSPQTANNQIRLTVTAKDSFDNLINDYKSAGTLTIEETTGAITWGGTGITDGTDPGGTYAGSSFSSGIAEITITNTASDSDKSIVVTDTATGKSGTSKVSWNPGALHHFTIASLTGQTAGTAFPVTITARDANDNIVTEFISTVALSDFTATLTPANTGNFVKGSWTGNITITKALTGNKITVTSSKTGFSNEFTVSAGTASKLAMAIDPPATIKAGENFGSQMKINICDAFGNVVSSNSHSQVTASIGSSGTVALNGTLTITASNGVASFANLSYSKAEPIKIRFYSGSLTPVETNTITVLPGAISSYIVSSSSPQTAGTGFSGTITAKDQFGNIVLNDSATVINLTSNGSGTFYTSSNYGVTTTSYTLNSGVANYFVKDTKAEVIAISAKDNNLISGSSASITVSPLPASKLILDKQPSTATTAGQRFAIQPIVNICDAYGNLITNDNSSQITAAVGSAGSSTLQGTLTLTASNGTVKFTNLGYNKAETLKINFTSGALTNVESNAIAVNPGAISSYTVSSSSPQTAGAGFSGTITAKDQHSNTVTTDSTTVVNVSAAESGATFYTANDYATPTISYTLVSGVAIYFVKDTKAEVIAISAVDSNSKAGTSNAILINPAALHHFSINSNSPQVANNPISLTVKSCDIYNNTITTYGSAGTLAIAGTTGSITWSGTGVTDQADPNGTYNGSGFLSGAAIININNTASDANKTVTITDTVTGLTGTAVISWIAGNLDHFEISAVSTPQIAGTAFPVTIAAKDSSNNTIP